MFFTLFDKNLFAIINHIMLNHNSLLIFDYLFRMPHFTNMEIAVGNCISKWFIVISHTATEVRV